MFSSEDTEFIRHCQGRLIVGYSGGIDSHVLLHYMRELSMRELSKSFDQPLCALHINHGLSDSAAEWQAHCESVCADLGVPLSVQGVHVEPRGSVEASARKARYEAFENYVESGDVLLLAQHEDDQIETIFLHLLRGDSPFGIRGMPRSRTVGKAQLLRPLLSTPKKLIKDYAQENNLRWVEDDSNLDTTFDRNYLRHKVLPLLKARWPQLPISLKGTLDRTRIGMEVIDNIAESDLDTLLDHQKISLGELAEYSSARQKNILRAWFKRKDVRAVTGDRLLDVGLRDFFEAGIDAAPLISWQGFELRRYDNYLYLHPGMRQEDNDSCYSYTGVPVRLVNGTLTARLRKGQGLKIDDLASTTIRFRSGGEKLKFHRRRLLKNVFQENRIPAFLRDYIPIIYIGEEPVAISGISSWDIPPVVVPDRLASGPESGYLFDWTF